MHGECGRWRWQGCGRGRAGSVGDATRRERRTAVVIGKPKPRISSCIAETISPGPSVFLRTPRTPLMTHWDMEYRNALKMLSSWPTW